MKKSERAQIKAELRKKYLDIIHEGILMNAQVAKKMAGFSGTDELQKEVLSEMYEEINIVSNVLSAIKLFGVPASLIAVLTDGCAVDLLSRKDLKDEDAFNQLLDNLKKE